MTAPVLDPVNVPLDSWSAAAWRELLDEPPRRGSAAEFSVEVFTPQLVPLGMVTDYGEARFKKQRRGVGPAKMLLPGSTEFADLLMKADTTVIPVRITYNDEHYDGFVDTAVRKGIKGNKTITVTLVDSKIFLSCIFAYPMPIPGFEEVQFPPEDLFVGPLKGGIHWYSERNFFRLRFRTGQCPVTMLPYDFFSDRSEWTTMQARMVSLEELFDPVLKDSDVMIEMGFFIKGRDKQPSDRVTLLSSQVWMRVVDRPKSGGINTGVAPLDGLANTIAQMIADGVDSLIGGFLPGLAEQISKHLKQTEIPSCIWTEDSAGIIDATLEVTHPQAYSVIVGGKSPTWLNKLLSLAIEQGIIALATAALTALSIPIGGLGGIIGAVAGALSTILDDVFLAFMKATNYKAKRELGPLARPEKFVNGGSAGYTFSSKQRADQGIFDIAGKRRAKVSIIDWAPHAAFRDFDIGHLVGWEDEGEMFTDRVESIEVVDTREDRVLVDTIIGDDEPEKSPQQRNQERFKRLFSMFNAMTLATN
ncbi:hypothetical protein CH296_28030 [Rhodococcus sp. 14-2496-1d]|uniref:Gp37-like protein n=1 Tax=Rhodococcus sp. 14-2496-1d TaxID=2023146 RepID=UPI000B9A9443|nr:hypothetical protein [Rhodococcus sp. 14-2496-1d]OZF25192.1 hypothetical protein CH296_28030 [Rhodococcus sp. 14-2496-1d]